MNHLEIQRAASECPHDARRMANLAQSIQSFVKNVSRRILRGDRDTAELRAEMEAVGFASVWGRLSEIRESVYDDEQQYLRHIERIVRRPMEKARDAQFRPAGLGRDLRRERRREQDQNRRQQVAGHRLPSDHCRVGGSVEHRQCLNGCHSWNGGSDDICDDREARLKVRAWRLWIVDEVQRLLIFEPSWLRRAVNMAMTERRFGIGKRKWPSVSAIARELDQVDYRVLSSALWRLACTVAAGAPDFVTIDGVTIEPDSIGQQQLGHRWDEAVAEGEQLRLLTLLFDAAA